MSAQRDELRRALTLTALAAALWGVELCVGHKALERSALTAAPPLPPPLSEWSAAEVRRPGWEVARLERQGEALRVGGAPLDAEALEALEAAFKGEVEVIEWREVYTEEGLARLGLSEAALTLRVEGVGVWRIGVEEGRSATWLLARSGDKRDKSNKRDKGDKSDKSDKRAAEGPPWRAAKARGRLRRALDRPPESWRDHALPPPSKPLRAARLTRVVGGAREEVWRLERGEGGWRLAHPAGLPLDARQAEVVGFTLSGLRVERFVSGERLETHQLSLEGAEGARALSLSASGGRLWAAAGGEWGLLPEHLSALIPLRADALVSRRVCDLPAEGLRLAEWRGGESGWRLSRGEAGWLLSPPGQGEAPAPAAPERVERLLSALSGVASGVASPVPQGRAPVGELRLLMSDAGACAGGCERALSFWRAGALVGVTREWDGLSLWLSEAAARAMWMDDRAP